MKINSNDLSKEVLERIRNPDPLEGEDILIEDGDGNVLGAIIQPDAYKFLLRKIEEREDKLASALDEKYDPNAPTLDDLMGE